MHYGGSYPALETDPAFVAHPGPGFNIAGMVPSQWFVQAGTADTPPLEARVFGVDSEEEMPMRLEHHFSNFSSFAPDGWSPTLDIPYRVELYDDMGALFGSYETTFIRCP